MRISSIPQIYRNINRWGEIVSVLSKYGLAGWIQRFDLSFAKGFLKNRDGESLATLPREQRIRLALEELGPTFIKLGQILSTRPDLVGVQLADELSKLQTAVPADAPDVVRQIIEQELNQPIAEIFREFDDVAVASASMGQVHRATLKDGTAVAVKVQHRGIQHRVRVDLDILLGLGQMAEKVPELAPYRPHAAIGEFQRAIRRELDFSREERNMTQFAQDFDHAKDLQIPRVYPLYCTNRIVTMEWISGMSLGELPHKALSPEKAAQLAHAGAEAYLQMVFVNGFYHADPHPGNIVVTRDGRLALLDFGMVGRIEAGFREEFEDLLLAITAKDSARLTSVVMRMGTAPATLDERALAIDLADFVGHFGNQPLDSFDLTGCLQEMIDIIRRYEIVLPSAAGPLIRMFMLLESSGRLLEPNFNIMQIAEPMGKKLLWRRYSPARHARKWWRILFEMEDLAESMPRRIREIMQQIQSGKFDVHLDHRGLEPSINRLVLGMLTSALFLGSSLLMSQTVWPIYGVSVPGSLGYLLSLVLGLRLLRAINKSGHLDRR